jgi:hypothetical protein
MARHLDQCTAYPTRTRARPPARAAKGPRTRFHLRAEGRHMAEYWLDLEIDGGAPLAELDSFLRRTWLECCGHLSEFRFGRTRYLPHAALVDDDFPGFEDAQSMRTPFATALASATARLKNIGYVYDFGSSTELVLRVLGRRPAAAPLAGVRLLARNDPLDWQCPHCEEAAAWCCTLCQEAPLCERHAREHDCDEGAEFGPGEGLLPVVDSPRMGVCSYEGTEPARPTTSRRRKRR